METPRSGLPSNGVLAGLAGLGLVGVGATRGLGTMLRWAAPVGGAYLGWNQGSNLLRHSGVGQSVVGWLANSPVGGVLGHDPYRPVGGALGALAGLALGRFF